MRLSQLPRLAEFAQFPAFSVRFREQFVGFGHVCDAQVFGIPFEGAPCANGHHTQQDTLGQRPREAKVGSGGTISPAGLDPFEMMAYGRWNRLGRGFERVHARLGQQPWPAASPTFDEDFALVSDEDDPVFRVQFLIFLEFIGPGRQDTAVIPVELEGRAPVAFREVIMDRAGQG